MNEPVLPSSHHRTGEKLSGKKKQAGPGPGLSALSQEGVDPPHHSLPEGDGMTRSPDQHCTGEPGAR